MKITRMRQERISKGWSQQYVADIIGLTRVAVHDIETSRQLPSYKILVKLEDLFKLSHRDLLKIVKAENEGGQRIIKNSKHNVVPLANTRR